MPTANAAGATFARPRSVGLALALAAIGLGGIACDLGTLTQLDNAPLKVVLSTDTVFLVGAQRSLMPPATASSLTNAQLAWSSSTPSVATVSDQGVVTAVGAGVAVISLTVSAPELTVPAVASRQVVSSYAGLIMAAIDSLTGLGQVVTPLVSGTNVSGQPVQAVAATLTSSDPTVLQASGQSIAARKNGTATVTATYLAYSAQRVAKVRQVAKRITFSTSPFVFRALNADTVVGTSAVDTRDSAIATPAIAWISLDTMTVRINAVTGSMRALKKGSTTVRATRDTAIATLAVSVLEGPATLTKTSGDAQSATVATPVSALPTVTALDVGGLPVPGALVTFAVTAGGGTLSGATVTTNASGVAASASWTLGTVAGTNSVTASVNGATAVFTATGTPAAPTKLTFASVPTSGSAGVALTPIVVSVFDQYNNPVTSATNSVTLSASGGTISGPTTRNALSGVVTFDNITALPSTGLTLAAASAGLAAPAAPAAFVVLGPAAKLAFSVQPTASDANALIVPAVQVAAQDAAGNPVTSYSGATTVAIGTNPAAGVLGGTKTVSATSGVAAFPTLTIDKSGIGYTLMASAAGLTSATSSAFTINCACWIARASLPAGRGGVAGTSLNNLFYIAGGFSVASGLSNALQAYDPATNTWTARASMSVARTEAALTTVNGLLYVIGGSTGVATSLVEAYNPATNTWTTMAPMPTPRHSVEAAVVNGKIYAIGGVTTGSIALATVEVYDPVANTWSTGPSMQTARRSPAVAAVGGIIYAAGGVSTTAYLNTVEALDVAAGTWSSRATMSVTRYAARAAVINGQVMVVGGYQTSELAAAEMYDPVTNTWKTRTSYPVTASHIAIGVVNGVLYGASGYSPFPTTLSSVYQYQP